MMPILYDAEEREFCNNGIGILNDCIACDIVQELNGQYEITMKYPVAGIHFSSLGMRKIVLAKPSPEERPQPFRIYRITKPLGGAVTILGRHIAYDLDGMPVSPFVANSATEVFPEMKKHCVTQCPFQFSTDKTTTAPLQVNVPTAVWDLLGGTQGSILDVYGGEYVFDRMDIKLLRQRGTDRGVSVRYGKNLRNLEQDECCANCYTAVYPYWTNSEGIVVELPEKTVEATGNYDYVRVKPLELSAEWQEAPTIEKLRDRAKRFITENKIGIPKVSWKIEFSTIKHTEAFQHVAVLEQASLGDTVSVFFPDMGINATSRIVTTTFNAILEEYKSVTLGSLKATLAQTIVQQKTDIGQKVSVATVEKIAKAAVKEQTQEAIFNILSNNGEYDGMWMKDGKLYFNLTYAQSGFLSAENIDLSGKFTVYPDTETGVSGGYMGYMAGSTTGTNKTDGIGMSNKDETVYVIVTTKGVRLQSGTVDLNIPLNGAVNLNGNLVVNGDIQYTGALINEQ